MRGILQIETLAERAHRRRGRTMWHGLALLPFLLFAHPALAEGESVVDLPFEQLLKTDIITAAKIARQISDAPSAVSIVTAEDIKTFGYRSLSDILDSMRGLTIAHDDSYGYLSGRGYGNGGSYAGRFTLLIDGYRAPDNYYGQTYFGNDALLDVELIERVEYIPGSGSSSYGDAAFLGVINIVTKKGRDVGGTEASTEFGSHGWRRNRLTFGRQFDSGLDLVLSASGMRSEGRKLRIEATGYDGGTVENDRNSRYLLKAAYHGWTFESASVDRWIPYPGARASDLNSFARLRYDGDVTPKLKTSIDAYYGRNRYIEEPDDKSYSFLSGGDWRGVDAKLVGTWFDRHTIVLGTEYRDDFRQGEKQYDPFLLGQRSPGSYEMSFSRRTASLYAYDDIALASNLQLSLGGRQDSRNDHGSTFSPRGALVWMPTDGTTLKLSTGTAHRQQAAFSELLIDNSHEERVMTRELVWEQMLGRRTRLIGSLYRYRIDSFLAYIDSRTGLYRTLNSKGAEIELEHLWDNGVRLRSSYVRQYEHDEFGQLGPNMARDIAKFNLSVPLGGEYLRAGLGARYLGKRLNHEREFEPGVLVADLTLGGRWNSFSASFSVRNLGNVGYKQISGAFGPGGIYPAERRTFWTQLEYDFK